MGILAALGVTAAVGMASLAASVPWHGVVSSGEVRKFRVELAAFQVADCRVDQGEHDLTIAVVRLATATASSWTVDGRERGVELVSVAAGDTGGEFALEVRPAGADMRRLAFRVICEAPRSERPDDRDRFEAARVETEARRLFRTGNRASFPEAIEGRQRALVLWRAVGERDAELATLVGLGDAYYRSSRYADAEQAYKEALALSGDLGDRRTDAEVLTNLAVNGRLRAELFDSLDWSRRALELWRALRLPYGLAIGLTNRGVLLREAGEYDAAQQHHARALAIFRDRGDRRAQAYALNNRAIVFEDLNQPTRALQDLSRAITLFQRVGETRAEGRALVSRARILLRLGRVREAQSSIEEGLPRVRQSPDGLALADAIQQQGRVAAAAGDSTRARTGFEEALTLYRKLASRKGESDTFHDLALLTLASGDAAAAMPLFEQALALRRATALRSLQAETLIDMARANRTRGEPALGRQHAAEAVAILERLHTDVIARELRSSHFGVIRRYYAEYLDGLVALHRLQPDAGFAAEAFEASERAKARGLIDLLQESRANIAAHVDPALLRRERELRQALNFWSWTLWQQADKAPNTASTRAEVEVQRLLAAHDDAEGRILRADARYSSLIRPVPLSLDELRRDVLNPDTMLIEYALGERQSYGWAVTADRLTLIDLPGGAEIERHANRLYDLVSTNPERSTTADRQRSIAREIAWFRRVLVEPMTRLSAHRRVLVVPDGAMHNVPFALLLGARHDVITLPSATVLAFLRRDLAQRPPAPKMLAVFADPVFDPADARVTPSMPAAGADATRRRLSRVPFTSREADAAMSLSPSGEKLRAVGFDATRQLAVGPSLADYRYLHFATHAIRDDRHPELSGIVLSLVGRDGKKRDGFLRLHDIYNLRLQADLVILSGCETGMGRRVNGEGLVGLARGFMYAGAAGVLSTLWKVDDEATSVMMELFYRALFHGKRRTPAAALAEAQAAMRKNPRFADPFYWSAFQVAGQQ